MVTENRVSPATIVASVAEAYGLSVDAIMAHKRGTDPLPDARHVAMEALERSGYNPTEIGRAMDRSHTMVLHALHRVHADLYLDSMACTAAWPTSDPLVVGQPSARGAAMALTMLTVTECRAVARYVTDMLLTERPKRGTDWATGLWVLARHPAAVVQLAASLVNVGYAADRDRWRDCAAGIVQRITYHIRAAGYTRSIRSA